MPSFWAGRPHMSSVVQLTLCVSAMPWQVVLVGGMQYIAATPSTLVSIARVLYGRRLGTVSPQPPVASRKQ